MVASCSPDSECRVFWTDATPGSRSFWMPSRFSSNQTRSPSVPSLPLLARSVVSAALTLTLAVAPGEEHSSVAVAVVDSVRTAEGRTDAGGLTVCDVDSDGAALSEAFSAGEEAATDAEVKIGDDGSVVAAQVGGVVAANKLNADSDASHRLLLREEPVLFFSLSEL